MLLRGLGASGDVLRATWSGLGLSWMPLGASGEALGGLLGCSWGLLGGSWRPLGAILGPLGAVLGPLGAVLWVMLPQVDFQKNQDRFYEDFEVPKVSQERTKMELTTIQIRSRNRR